MNSFYFMVPKSLSSKIPLSISEVDRNAYYTIRDRGEVHPISYIKEGKHNLVKYAVTFRTDTDNLIYMPRENSVTKVLDASCRSMNAPLGDFALTAARDAILSSFRNFNAQEAIMYTDLKIQGVVAEDSEDHSPIVLVVVVISSSKTHLFVPEVGSWIPYEMALFDYKGFSPLSKAVLHDYVMVEGDNHGKH